ncbi:MAG: cation:proton antiporter [Sulfolobales archaeon]|nr:cation:proton antiporter [Sulfolobales archaeon]MCX8199318.1 cation:proton antiporter [Sulfolobales archaeon]MDW8170369.1 cation:proton antiporter [Desulfurococcaceae archaeon]
MDAIVLMALTYVIGRAIALPLEKKGFSQIVSFIAVGLIASYVLGIDAYYTELKSIAMFSAAVLMFYVGLSADIESVKGASPVIIGVAGVVTTFTLTYLALTTLGLSFTRAIVLSISISNTATEVVGALLLSLSEGDVRAIASSASFIDDIIVAIAIATIASGEIAPPSIVAKSIPATALIAISMLMPKELLKKYKGVAKVVFRSYRNFVITSMSALFSLTIASYVAGLGPLIGAYLAGLVINGFKEHRDPMIRASVSVGKFLEDLNVFLDTTLVPLFFSYAGLTASVMHFDALLFLTLLTTGLIGKIIGCGMPSAILLKNLVKGLKVGTIMVARGSLDAVLLSSSLSLGLIYLSDYSTAIAAILATMFFTPLALSMIGKQYGL